MTVNQSEADFGGYASKNDLLCSDGRTIKSGAFAHMDGKKVPLVWQHQHGGPGNVLGHAILENRRDGVYARAFFNDSTAGQDAKTLVKHGDIDALSIYADKLQHAPGKIVTHGNIKEVSLCISGANPESFIDYVNLAHADGSEDGDEGILFLSDEDTHLEHGDITEEAIETAGLTEQEENMGDQQLEHSDVLENGKSPQDVYKTLDADQKILVDYLVGTALEHADVDENGEVIQHSNITFDNTEVLQHIDSAIQEGFTNMGNLFETADTTPKERQRKTLSHSDMETIFKDASGKYMKLSESVLAHAGDYGIDDIELLFPDARTLSNSPEILSRRMEWVAGVLGGTKHSPFSRIKTIQADITADEARAKGYVKGNLKKDEIIKLLRRVTTPTTIYKKQKLDRDDIVDIVDFDVLAWLKAEMRVMLDEEIARAILVGDGRDQDDEDKINEDHIRPIAFDDDMYAAKVNLVTDSTPSQTIEAILRARSQYKGSGNPVMYTTDEVLTDLILDKDSLGRRYYDTTGSLAAAMRVSDIIPVEALEDTPEIIAIIVNLSDYTVGADKGGEINFFDDFDIDYNQQKYLIETRISGALTKAKSALVIRRAAGTVVTPAQPAYNATTHVITIPNTTGVIYSVEGVDKAAGATVTITETSEVEARPASHYSFPHEADKFWTFVF